MLIWTRVTRCDDHDRKACPGASAVRSLQPLCADALRPGRRGEDARLPALAVGAYVPFRAAAPARAAAEGIARVGLEPGPDERRGKRSRDAVGRGGSAGRLDRPGDF